MFLDHNAVILVESPICISMKCSKIRTTALEVLDCSCNITTDKHFSGPLLISLKAKS